MMLTQPMRRRWFAGAFGLGLALPLSPGHADAPDAQMSPDRGRVVGVATAAALRESAASVVADNPFLRPLRHIAAEDFTSMVVETDGRLWAWGENDWGQVGDGTTSARSSPLQIMTGVATVETGSYSTLAVQFDGTLWAWGANWDGQLGDGTDQDRYRPTRIMTGVAAVAAGNNHSLALKTDGSLWAWGYNGLGQLGDGTRTDRLSPIQIMTGVAAVAAGAAHSVALKTDGTLWTWGYNCCGQLGDGSQSWDGRPPTQIMTGVTAVATGLYVNFAIKTDGSLWAWGKNDEGQLGDGTTMIRRRPVRVMARGVAAVATGGRDVDGGHTLVIKTDRSLWGWGNNALGQLGDGTTTNRSSPVQIMTGIAAVACGAFHNLAIKTNGRLWAWGINWYGEDTQTIRLSPDLMRPGLLPVAWLRTDRDINGDGAPDLALFAVNENKAIVKSHSGNPISEVPFDQALSPIRFDTIDNFGGTPAPELVVLGHDGQVEIRDGRSGERLAAWAFSSAPPVDLQILPDRNGNGVPELAMLGRTRLPVEVRDGRDGDLIASVAFNSLLEPRDLLVMDDRTGDGTPELGLLGEHDDPNQAARMQVRDSVTDSVHGHLWLGKGFTPHQARELDDRNGDGSAEVAVLRSAADGKVDLVVQDPVSGRLLTTIGFGRDVQPIALLSVPDINGNGAPEVGVLLRNPTSGAQWLDLKDSSTKALLTRLWLPMTFEMKGAEVLPDLNGNGASEIAVLGQRARENKRNVYIRDTATGELLQKVGF